VNSYRKSFIQLVEAEKIPASNTQAALRIAKISPDGKAWYQFIDHLLLWLGSLAIAVSMLFFVAFNWIELSRLAKFAIVQSALAVAIIAYWLAGADKPTGKAALMAAAVILGVLLALFGQTYQTGADPWQLFFTWALMLLPWAVIGQFSAIWVFCLLLLNIALTLYFHTYRGGFSILFGAGPESFWWSLGINAAALTIWEILTNRFQWMQGRWAPRLLALWCFTPLTWLTVLSILDDWPESGFGRLIWLVWPLAMVATWAFYRHVRRDLFMLALGCFSGLIVVVILFTRHFVTFESADSFLLIAMLTIGLGAGSTIWLRNVYRQWHEETEKKALREPGGECRHDD